MNAEIIENKITKLTEHREYFISTKEKYVSFGFFIALIYFIYKSYTESIRNAKVNVAIVVVMLFSYFYGHFIVYNILNILYKVDKYLISKIVFLQEDPNHYHVPAKLVSQNEI